MNKQFLIWSMLIVPWFSLLLIKKDILKRYMPAALFTGLTSGIIYQIGIAANFWYFEEIAFPLVMYGLLPVAALWALRFTYGRYWLYAIVNAISDLVFAFVIFTWFDKTGLLSIGPWTGLIVYFINFIHSALIYGYQMWQENRIGK